MPIIYPNVGKVSRLLDVPMGPPMMIVWQHAVLCYSRALAVCQKKLRWPNKKYAKNRTISRSDTPNSVTNNAQHLVTGSSDAHIPRQWWLPSDVPKRYIPACPRPVQRLCGASDDPPRSGLLPAWRHA